MKDWRLLYCWEDGQRKRVSVSRCPRDKRIGECGCSVSIQFKRVGMLNLRKSCISHKEVKECHRIDLSEGGWLRQTSLRTLYSMMNIDAGRWKIYKSLLVLVIPKRKGRVSRGWIGVIYFNSKDNIAQLLLNFSGGIRSNSWKIQRGRAPLILMEKISHFEIYFKLVLSNIAFQFFVFTIRNGVS